MSCDLDLRQESSPMSWDEVFMLLCVTLQELLSSRNHINPKTQCLTWSLVFIRAPDGGDELGCRQQAGCGPRNQSTLRIHINIQCIWNIVIVLFYYSSRKHFLWATTPQGPSMLTFVSQVGNPLKNVNPIPGSRQAGGVRVMLWAIFCCENLASKFPRCQSDGRSVLSSGKTSLIHGGPTTQLIGLKGCAANILVTDTTSLVEPMSQCARAVLVA